MPSSDVSELFADWPCAGSLARVLDQGIEPSLTNVRVRADGTLECHDNSLNVGIRFVRKGSVYTVDVVPSGHKATLYLQCRIGYLPYTIQGPGQRKAILDVLRSAEKIPNARFYLTSQSEIIAEHAASVIGPVHFADVMMAVTVGLPAIEPFIGLIREILDELPSRATADNDAYDDWATATTADLPSPTIAAE